MTVVIFRNRLRPEAAESYAEVAHEMEELAQEQPGFLRMKSFVAADGERVTLAEFEDEVAVRAWGEHAAHKAAQERGRSEFYSAFHLQVCEVTRERRFP